MTVDGCLSHPWIKNMESQGGVINRERLSEFQAQYKLRVGVNYILYITYRLLNYLLAYGNIPSAEKMTTLDRVTCNCA